MLLRCVSCRLCVPFLRLVVGSVRVFACSGPSLSLACWPLLGVPACPQWPYVVSWFGTCCSMLGPVPCCVRALPCALEGGRHLAALGFTFFSVDLFDLTLVTCAALACSVLRLVSCPVGSCPLGFPVAVSRLCGAALQLYVRHLCA